MMLSPGVQLSGRYRLDERIAGGGMGDVWRGTDEVLGRTVAVKILLPALLEEPGFAERFRGEARTMANINHPGVVDVYDYGSDEDTAYLVMEYVEGDALSTTLGRVGRLTPARTMALVAQAADALHAAHEKGIVHRDVKPGNLLVRPNGTLVLTDFGIARSALVGQLTVAGSVLGTASYISPEQAAGGVASPASDVYALGVVAYQCLTGRRPFEGDTPFDIAMKHVRDVPTPLPAEIPSAVRAIVERAMAKDPPARWSSAAQMAAVAHQAAASLGTPTGGPTSPLPPPVRVTSPAPSGRVPAPPRPARVAAPVPVARPAAPASNARPVSPRPQSAQAGYVRGAAAVAPSQPRPAPPQGYRYASPASAPRRSGRTGWVVFLAVVAALVIVICSGLIAYRIANELNNAGNGSRTSDRGAGAGAAAAAQADDIPCGQYAGQKYEKVKEKLQDAGYRVVGRFVPGPAEGRVLDVSPCRVAQGDLVTVRVATGKARGLTSCGGNDGSIDCWRDQDD